MSNVVRFPNVNGAYCSGRSMPVGLTPPDHIARAWSNFYSAERRNGASPELAHSRADVFVRDLERMQVVGQTMAEG